MKTTAAHSAHPSLPTALPTTDGKRRARLEVGDATDHLAAGIGLLELSSAAGHLGRAFGLGYAAGEAINWGFEKVTGTSIGSAIYDAVNGD